MAKINESLRKLHKSWLAFVNFMQGREETDDVTTLPTQRNQYFT